MNSWLGQMNQMALLYQRQRAKCYYNTAHSIHGDYATCTAIFR